jgi:hypothetical protein
MKYLAAVIATALLLPVALAQSSNSKTIEFAGFVLGDTHDNVASLATKKRRKMLGPQNVMDMELRVFSSKFRIERGLGMDSGVRNTQVYFTNTGRLYGYDLFVKSKTSFTRYRTKLKSAGFKDTGKDQFKGKMADGDFKDAEITAEFKTVNAGGRAYKIEVRCREILAKTSEKKDYTKGAGKNGAAAGAVGRAL